MPAQEPVSIDQRPGFTDKRPGQLVTRTYRRSKCPQTQTSSPRLAPMSILLPSETARGTVRLEEVVAFLPIPLVHLSIASFACALPLRDLIWEWIH
jgi:hypothetical protein